MAAGLKTIIALSFVCWFIRKARSKLMSSQVLAIGFLLVILSAALFHNYLTLLVVATYVIAPLPNWICSRCANPDDFVESAGNAVIDFGRFCTGFLVVMGIGKPPLYKSDETDRPSASRAACSYQHDSASGYGHVHHWRLVDLWHHHKLLTILQRRARLLMRHSSLAG
jgi:hypothetical protein